MAWDPNNEADLAGYTIYYKSGSVDVPYIFLIVVYVDELLDPGNPMVTVTNSYDDLVAEPNRPGGGNGHVVK